MTNKNIMSNLLLFFISIMFIVPYLPTFIPITATLIGGFYLHDMVTVALVVMVLLSALIVYKEELFISFTQVFIFAFIVVLVIQLYFIHGYQSYTFMAIATLLLGIFLTFIVQNYVNDKKQLIHWIAVASIINCYLQIIIVVLQMLSVKLNVPINFYNYELTSTYGYEYNLLIGDTSRVAGGLYQPNLLANTLVCGVLALIHLSNKIHFIKKTLFLHVFIMSVFIALTLSRMVYIYGIAGILYGLIAKNHKTAVLISGILLILVSIAVNNGMFDMVTYHDRHEDRIVKAIKNIQNADINLSHKIDNQRFVMWNGAVTIFTKNPILGAGWGNYAKELLADPATILPQFSLPFNPHNLFLQILSTTGIVGFVLFLYAIYWYIKNGKNGNIFTVGYIIVNLLHSQVEYPLFYLSYLYGFLIFLATIDDSKKIYVRNIYFKSIGVMTVTIAIWEIYFCTNAFLIIAQFKTPIEIKPDNLAESMKYKYQLSLNPLWSYYADVYLVQKVNINDKVTSDIAKMIYGTLKQVSSFTPYPEFKIKMAVLEEKVGNSSIAQELINNIVHIYPKFIDDIKDEIKQNCGNNIVLRQKMLNYIN